nr:hypothetical protein Itr_chr12CG20530 [Ipomoea trifida]
MDRVDVNLPLEILPKEAIPPHTQENIDFESLRINPRMHVIKEEPIGLEELPLACSRLEDLMQLIPADLKLLDLSVLTLIKELMN